MNTDAEWRWIMRYRSVSIPQLGLIASTRGMLGAGIGLLLADRLSDEQRRAVGWTLVGVGVVTTIPLLAWVFGTERSGGELAGRSSEAMTVAGL